MNTHPADPSLNWTMRVIGLLLAGTCVFLLTRDAGYTAQSMWMLALGAALGVITLVSSWVPARAQAPEPERVRA